MSAATQFAQLTFDKLLAAGKVEESQREAFYLGAAAGIGWARERLGQRFVTTSQLTDSRKELQS